MLLYRLLSLATAFIATGLFVCLLVSPNLIFWLFNIEDTTSAAIMSRRAAMLFLGFALITWLGRNADHSDARQAIAAGIAATMLGLVIVGLTEFVRGAVGPGIFFAIVAEVIIGVLYLRVWMLNRGVSQ